LAHNVIVLNRGQIVERGETETIFARPQHAYTRLLLAAELPIEWSASRRSGIAVPAFTAERRA